MLVAEKCTEILFTAIYVAKQNEISFSWPPMEAWLSENTEACVSIKNLMRADINFSGGNTPLLTLVRFVTKYEQIWFDVFDGEVIGKVLESQQSILVLKLHSRTLLWFCLSWQLQIKPEQSIIIVTVFVICEQLCWYVSAIEIHKNNNTIYKKVLICSKCSFSLNAGKFS